MTRPRVVFHIGHTKAASTTIQRAVELHADALRAEGFRIADHSLGFPTSGPLGGPPVDHLRALREYGPEGVARFVEHLAPLAAGSTPPRAILISAENLHRAPFEQLARALRPTCRVEAIYYVRRQDEWTLSAWTQWGLKEGRTLEEQGEHQIRIDTPDYLEAADRWAGACDQIRVRPLVTQALVGGDVVVDFFDALGARTVPETVPAANVAHDRALLEVLADSRFLFPSKDDWSFDQWLESVVPYGFPSERAVLDPDVADRVLTHFEPSNRALHARYFPDVGYDAVFGPRSRDARASGHDRDAELARLRRVVGLQFDLIRRLEDRLRAVENDRRDGG